MAGQEESLPLQEYIRSLSPSSLPRIVQICCGVYFQGSIYELSGNEVSLSTGDLVKIISFELQKVICEDHSSATAVELPPNFEGHFRLLPDKTYSSIGEVSRALSSGKDRQPSAFASVVDFSVNKHNIKAFQAIFWRGLSSDSQYAKCITKEDHGNVCFKIPLTIQGEFYAFEGENLYTLSEMLQLENLAGLRVTCSSLRGSALSLTPVYEVHAVMQLRPNVVKIPSNLEVDLVDVTEECCDVKFIKSQSLHEVLEFEHTFPVVAELLETPDQLSIFKNDWFRSLQKGQKLIFHKRASTCKILASSSKGKKEYRYFFISSSYNGKFKRKPQEFPTAYDLLASLKKDTVLQVVVTKDCEGEFASLCAGDRLKVNFPTSIVTLVDGVTQQTDVLPCTRECSDDEDEPEKIMLPLYAEGRFLEEVTDNKRYTISNIIENFKLPCEFKVAGKDSSMPNDTLGSFFPLTLEEVIQEPFVVTSFLSEPSLCFDLPLKWFSMSLFFTEDLPPVVRELTSISTVEEVTDSFYYKIRKLFPSSGPPPPRPPKRQTTNKPLTAKEVPEPMLRKLSLPHPLDRTSPTVGDDQPVLYPRKPKERLSSASNLNNYAPNPVKKQMATARTAERNDAFEDDDQHNYEEVDQVLLSTIKKMSETVLHY
ncbi:protein THEMIS2 [Pleurodeles waltl]|uniref:protein THEMIS2 n=1 Tax=Pleurodeles waltl TaxID=8319 RepID=UPI0037093AC0